MSILPQKESAKRIQGFLTKTELGKWKVKKLKLVEGRRAYACYYYPWLSS